MHWNFKCAENLSNTTVSLISVKNICKFPTSEDTITVKHSNFVHNIGFDNCGLFGWKYPINLRVQRAIRAQTNVNSKALLFVLILIVNEKWTGIKTEGTGISRVKHSSYFLCKLCMCYIKTWFISNIFELIGILVWFEISKWINTGYFESCLVWNFKIAKYWLFWFVLVYAGMHITHRTWQCEKPLLTTQKFIVIKRVFRPWKNMNDWYRVMSAIDDAFIAVVYGTYIHVYYTNIAVNLLGVGTFTICTNESYKCELILKKGCSTSLCWFKMKHTAL